MQNWVDIINFAIGIAGCTVSLMGVMLALRLQYLERIARHFFVAFFLVVFAYIASMTITHCSLLLLGPEYNALSKAAVFLESLFSSLLMPMLTVYLLKVCGQSLRCRLVAVVLALLCVYVVILIITQFTSAIYEIT